jgi:hypothetical protein
MIVHAKVAWNNHGQRRGESAQRMEAPAVASEETAGRRSRFSGAASEIERLAGSLAFPGVAAGDEQDIVVGLKSGTIRFVALTR